MSGLSRKLKAFFFFTLFTLFSVQAVSSSGTPSNPDLKRIETYLHFLNTFDESLGPSGDYSKGEIQVILDPGEIGEIEQIQQKRLIKRGFSSQDAEKMSKCGIIQTDTFWLWVRDAVIFPSGHKGTCNRVIWRAAVDGPGNVAILPVLKDRRIVLNLNYRHSTRSWEIELPRGTRLYGETPEKACRRELRAETGCLTEGQVYLGSITPDTSTVNTITPIFLGYVSTQVEYNQESSEAIIGLLTFTKEEIKEAFVRGFVEVQMQGEVKKVPMRDSFLAFALLQAEARDLI